MPWLITSYPVVGDVAKLDMFNISNPVVGDVAASQISYPVVGDVAKLDMLNISYPVVGDVAKLDIRLYAFHSLFVLMR